MPLSKRMRHADLCHSITEDSDICTCHVGEVEQLEAENKTLKAKNEMLWVTLKGFMKTAGFDEDAIDALEESERCLRANTQSEF